MENERVRRLLKGGRGAGRIPKGGGPGCLFRVVALRGRGVRERFLVKVSGRVRIPARGS